MVDLDPIPCLVTTILGLVMVHGSERMATSGTTALLSARYTQGLVGGYHSQGVLVFTG